MAGGRESSSSGARARICAADDIWRRHEDVVRRFIEVRSDYEQLCSEVRYILQKRIGARGIETSSITSRAKTLTSFLEKLERKHYDDPLAQITDLAGVRVVCLYRGDIAEVAGIVREEFVIEEAIDKLDELAVDQFGYGARHFVVRLGEASSGARYDDLKHLSCELQVRTVAQDAWAIIQHHLVYKREAQVPTQLQRKLNGLAGLFETADDQFDSIREERDAYLVGVRQSTSSPDGFLRNELNLDSFREYLKWAYPNRDIECHQGAVRQVLDGLLGAGLATLGDVDRIVRETKERRTELLQRIDCRCSIDRCADGSIASNIEPALALALVAPNWEELVRWDTRWAEAIREVRAEDESAG